MNTNELFYALLKERELPSNLPELRQILADENRQKELDALAQAFDCQIIYARSKVYLLPERDNDILGYSKAALKKRLLKNGQGVVFYYLYMFIILTLLDEFYGTSYGQGKTRPYIQVGNLMNHVHENLQKGAARDNAPAQVPYQKMLGQYESLKAELGKKEKNSRAQLFEVALRFLEEQRLIIRLEENDSIRTTQRLDDLADYVLRSSQGYELMMQILGGEEYAEA
ncbi:DUF6063 family protein [Allobaculum mucilyticum]|uniref:DUF6063 family protein n=1 Tax=Allobaculum mucilyticum TaxID=2834459 RepID=UPI001E477102|nr:DUF6063 family protein [Allobaculum mucilyticum]UNT97130.1 hypothetical protein KWG62_05115 [Allobaculum mucilyticum]